ncbi:predicted protein [Naegleria gruberi]|uniref:Predicted protein n=1 Tax=Naegleria gruberi TaxID=5762 RepID=D2V7L6_NAEGR|nr:uncharacterized protein NAEGRDRAFT_64847 [Naegleria gruberi]EFC47402.1 predicted protein [Naegleria gruberi]|eukprot:XP_002680146.1 predicted protein [Naegleria gruberi strain NEG-M]
MTSIESSTSSSRITQPEQPISNTSTTTDETITLNSANSPSTPRKASIMTNTSSIITTTDNHHYSTTTSPPNNNNQFSTPSSNNNNHTTPMMPPSTTTITPSQTNRQSIENVNNNYSSPITPMNLDQIGKLVDDMGELSGNGFLSRSSSTHSYHGSTNSTTIYNDIDIVKVAQFFDNLDASSLDEDTWKELVLNCFVPSSQHLSAKKKKVNRKHSKANETSQVEPLIEKDTVAETSAKSIILDTTTSVLSSKGSALMDLSGLYHISIHSLYRLKQLLYFRFFFFTTGSMKLSGNESSTLTVSNSLSVNRNSIKLNRNSTRFADLQSLGSPSSSTGSPTREVEVMSRKEFTSMKEDVLDTWKQFKFATEPSLKLLWTKYLLNTKFNSIQKCTLMHLASKYNQSVIMEWLFDECGPDFLFVSDAMKMTPLFYTSFFNATESCAFLCTKIKSSTIKTGVSRARNGSELVANPHSNSGGGSGRKSFFGNKNKADVPSPTSSSPATGASSPYNNNALEKIIQQVDDEFGYNVFYVALKRGCFAVCDMLILFGASLDTTIRGGETMLHRACFELPLDRIVYLIQKGAILLKKDQKGCVPLFNLVGREVEVQQVPTQPSPRTLSSQNSTKDVINAADEKSVESKRESSQVPDEDLLLIEEFLLEHEMSKEKDEDTINESTKYDSPRVDSVKQSSEHSDNTPISNRAPSPTTSVSSCDTDVSADIFQELDEMFVGESGEVNYENKNKLLTNDRRKKREPLKLPAALKMRSDSLAALSGINGMAGGGYTSNQQGVLLEDSIKIKSSPIQNNSSPSPANSKTNTNGSRFPNHISHFLQDEFQLKKNIMFKAMELLVPQMGWSTKTLILSAKKFYGLSEQEARDLFYNDPSERAKKLNPELSKNNSQTNNSSTESNNNSVLKRKQPILEAILPYISREQFIKVLKSQNYHGRNILHDCVIKGDLKSMQLIINELLQPRKSTLGSALRLAPKNVELTPEQKLAEKQKYDEESQENIEVLNELLMEPDNDKHQTCLAYACSDSNTFAVRYLLSLYNIVGVQMNKRPSVAASSVANLSPNQNTTPTSGGLLSTPRENSRSASTTNLSSPRVEPKQTLMYKVLHLKNKQGKTPLDIAKSSHVPCDDIIEMLTQSLEKGGSSSDSGSSSAFQFFKRKKK